MLRDCEGWWIMPLGPFSLRHAINVESSVRDALRPCQSCSNEPRIYGPPSPCQFGGVGRSEALKDFCLIQPDGMTFCPPVRRSWKAILPERPDYRRGRPYEVVRLKQCQGWTTVSWFSRRELLSHSVTVLCRRFFNVRMRCYADF